MSQPPSSGSSRHALVPASVGTRELSGRALVLGFLLAAIFAASNAYLGLYAGMTVSASIPAAVFSMALLRGLLRRGSPLEHNIVQTMASTGESMAAAVIFTLPALLISGVWQDVPFWPTALLCLAGGLLGIGIMIPMRRKHVLEDSSLPYPESIACAQVLKSETGGGGWLLISSLLGASFKLFSAGLVLFRTPLEGVMTLGRWPLYWGCELSAALLGVGYLVGFNIGALVIAGGLLTWTVAIPLHGLPPGDALAGYWRVWTDQARYLGVGAMIVGGCWSLVRLRGDIVTSLRVSFRRPARGLPVERFQRDLPPVALAALLLMGAVLGFGVLQYLSGSIAASLLGVVCILLLSLAVAPMASSLTGLVGSSNTPISGMTICAVLATSAVLLLFKLQGTTGMLTVLVTATVIATVAATAGDLSQNLKTGSFVAATPRQQELAKLLAAIVPALVSAPVIMILHHAYGIGTGQPASLKAPQATLFASLARGLLGEAVLPWRPLATGAAVGVILLVLDETLRVRQARWRAPVMAVAVGMYLPLQISVPVFLGGCLALGASARRHSQTGILFASGLVAGEALMGVIVGALVWWRRFPFPVYWKDSPALSLAAFLILVGALAWARRARAS